MEILVLFLLPLITSLLSLFVRGRLLLVVNLASSFGLLVAAMQLVITVIESGPQSLLFGNWPFPIGIEFYVDGISALLVLLISLVYAVVMVFMLYWQNVRETASYFPLLQLLVTSAIAVSMAADLFNLYVWFELMLIAVMGLLILGNGLRYNEAAIKYFSVSIIGTLLMLAAIGLIHGAVGQLNFSALHEITQDKETGEQISLFSGLLLLALLLKIGAFPLFAWLPAAYHILPTPVLALVGGLLTKISVYVILRISGQVLELGAFYDALGWLAVVTMLSGVLGAAYHWDLRRILAFHIVSQVGFLMLGVALASPAGTTGTAFFLYHNILVKTNLFLLAGMIYLTAGHYDLRLIGGLFSARPLLAFMFFISAISLVGVPPSSGFWGKLLIIQETLEQQHYWWAAAALITGLLTLYSMSKIWLEGFWKPHPEPNKTVAGIPFAVNASVLLLTLLILYAGLYPNSVIAFLQAQQSAFYGGQI